MCGATSAMQVAMRSRDEALTDRRGSARLAPLAAFAAPAFSGRSIHEP
jgi:hypothetical protein